MSTYNLQSAKTESEKVSNNLSHTLVQAPLHFITGNTFSLVSVNTGEQIQFELGKAAKKSDGKRPVSSVGKTYMIHSIGGDSQKSAFRELTNEEFAATFNNWVWNMPVEPTFTAIIDNKTKQLLGFPKEYTVIDNLTLLDFIAESPFANNLKRFSITAMESEFFFSLQSTGFQCGMVIKNGLTGHVCLSYNSRVVIGKEYTYDFSDSKKVKHLSQIAAWYESFMNQSEQIFITAVEQMLVAVDDKQTKNWLREYWLKQTPADSVIFHNAYYHKSYDNAMQCLAELEQEIKYGQKKVVRGAMDYILEKASELVKAQMGID